MTRPWQVSLVAIALAFGPACKGDSAGTSSAKPPEPGAPPVIDRTTPLPDPLPTVAATVNGQAIATARVKMLAEQALRSGGLRPDQRPFAYRQAMHQYIVRELLVQEALARGIQPDQKGVEQAEDMFRRRFKSAEEFRAALAEQGADEAQFKAELRAQATADALIAKLRDETPPESVSEEDARKFYEAHPEQFTTRDRVRAAHILIRVPPDVSPARKQDFRAKAEQALKEIQNGGDFAALAAKYSEDKSTSSRGGEMDPFGRGQMPAELSPLENAIRALSPGTVSEVVETRAGFHVVKLIEKLPDDKVGFDAVKDQVRQHLLGQKRHEALQSFVNSLRAKAKIETHL